MDDQFICVLRRPTDLAVLVSTRRQAFSRPKPMRADQAEVLADIDPYAEELRPLVDGNAYRRPFLTGVRESWENLGRVCFFDAQTLFHILHVLVHTLPTEDSADVPPLRIETPPLPFQPTAAHPRAYRGTKDRPPKGKRMAPLDLRPHLCVASDVNRLLAHLVPFLPEALPLLERAELSPEKLPHLIDVNGKAIDPLMQYWYSAGNQSVHDLPVAFRTHFLYCLLGLPWSVVTSALSIYWGLTTEAPLLRSFARFLAARPWDSAPQWGPVLLQQPAARQAAFAELLIEAEVQFRSPSERIIEMIGVVDRLSPDHVYRHRMFTLLDSLGCTNLGYFRDGFLLAQRYRVEFEFKESGWCDDFSIGAVQDLIEYVTKSTKTEAQWCPSFALDLWEASAILDGFGSFLEQRLWQGLEPDVAYEVMKLFEAVVYCDLEEEEDWQAKWRALRDFAPDLFDLLRGIEPGYREKAVRYLRDLAWFWDEPAALTENLQRYRKLLPRLCRPPFASETIPDALTSLTVLASPHWAELANSEALSFRRLEQASRRANDSWLIARGLKSLAEKAAVWTVRAFRECPASLFRAAQTLGCMRTASRQEVIRTWLAHPLLSLDLEQRSAEEIVQEIGRHRPAGVHNPIPRKLRETVAGRQQLRPGQVQRALRVTMTELTVTCVDLLYRLALASLARSVGPVPDTVEARHAVCLQGFIRDNRRALRRFLRAYFGGHHTYLSDHPLNRAWLSRHPRVADAWLSGLGRAVTLSDSSRLHLAVEDNPLEVLRLGTHVGTCLGLGGMMAHSAAAVVLDINKHVVYMRDVSGSVLGRQLLALSEDERLVCYSVYPLEAPPDLKRAFLDYDRAFARVLKVEMHDPNSKEVPYEIASLLSSDWWDDEPWDGQTK